MAQYKSCGRCNCRCSKGFKHGPFFYHVLYVQGIRYKSYVKKAEFDRINSGIEAFRAQRREQQNADEELRTMLKEIKEASRNVYAILRLRGFKV